MTVCVFFPLTLCLLHRPVTALLVYGSRAKIRLFPPLTDQGFHMTNTAAFDRAPATGSDFLTQLENLKQRFAAMKPEFEVTVRDPALGVEGHVVVWNTKISAGGPLQFSGKGGTRITPNLTLDEVRMLARTMALKNAAAGLPLGGAKSGLCANSSMDGFETQYRRFVSLCKPFLHENGGVFGGFGFDIGGKPEHALWACDELQSTRSFTGKPVHMGGTDYDREGIAGLGVATAAKAFLDLNKNDIAATRFAVQGMGAMGAAVLRYFSDHGAQLASMADPKHGGTWVFEKPLSDDLRDALIRMDFDKATALLPMEGTLISVDAADVLYHDVDVVFPCAVQNVITDENVGRIRARLVVEGANGPVAESARLALHDRGIMLIPDFIANPGGIIAAFVELTHEAGDKVAAAKAMTIAKITENVGRVVDLACLHNVAPVQAGMYLALSRIFDLKTVG